MTIAMISAVTMESQIPSVSQKSGRIRTAPVWNTSVLIKEIAADTRPLFKAVKKDDPKIANPENKNEKEKMEKARSVSDKSFSS